MILFPDPFDTLPGLQQALDTFRTSGWLQPSLSGGGTYPPMNVFRKGDDFIVITEVPGIKKSDIEVQVRAIRSVWPASNRCLWREGQPASP